MSRPKNEQVVSTWTPPARTLPAHSSSDGTLRPHQRREQAEDHRHGGLLGDGLHDPRREQRECDEHDHHQDADRLCLSEGQCEHSVSLRPWGGALRALAGRVLDHRCRLWWRHVGTLDPSVVGLSLHGVARVRTCAASPAAADLWGRRRTCRRCRGGRRRSRPRRRHGRGSAMSDETRSTATPRIGSDTTVGSTRSVPTAGGGRVSCGGRLRPTMGSCDACSGSS